MVIAFEKVIEDALNWLEKSDIRVKDPDSPFYGGYRNVYQAKDKRYPLIYCEITGYAIQFFLRIYRWGGKEQFLKFAEQAGDFLLKVQSSSQHRVRGAFPYGFASDSGDRIEKYFSFDNAVCLAALLELYNITKEQRYLDAALRAGTWLEEMRQPDGSFKAIAYGNEKAGNNLPNPESWFGDKSCLHAKNAIGLLKLSQVTGEKKFHSAAEKTLDWVLSIQNADGSIRANEREDYIFTHSHCYALEGLLFGSLRLKTQKFSKAALKGGYWLLSVQNKDGSLYKYYGHDIEKYLANGGYRFKKLRKAIRPRETGPTAQAARIWITLYHLTGEKKFFDAAMKSSDFLLSMRYRMKNDANSLGGFFSASDNFFGFRRPIALLSPWVAMFTCHALILLEIEKHNDEYVKELF